MVNFFRRNFPGVIVYVTLKEPLVDWTKDHAIDARIHISYLGRWYRRTDKDFPRKSYITADPQRLKKWQDWLSQFPKPWIGIGWKGGIQATQQHLRSIDLSDLKSVLSQNVPFFDLSYIDNSHEISKWNIDHPTQIICPKVDVKDYEDSIALFAAMDEVVSVTTSCVHACGALGRTAHVLVPEVAQWRYAYRFGDGTGLIWYPPSVKMYRQKPGESWGHAINRIAKAL